MVLYTINNWVSQKSLSILQLATIVDFREGYSLFGDPNPRGIRFLICDLGGFGFVRNPDIWQRNTERLEALN